ncbi:acetyl-CoA carboxylase biotin carboxyl carrier protein [Candidatus Deferrimicrobium sp.]|uniref:acetyl-CoA carboxylase biotin carboxyl carrier protein n=1 Tax=Candidatus Deferrimicrobium sp. TaxID=3060586 RepID=UPI00272BECB7|nr:acetyl-CoA carboxylase biotin carboxyl carrier protein [Candidatus Deferrimicrobium sp.]
MPMNLKEIREILELLKGSDVSEFELGRGDTVLKLRRGPTNVPVVLTAPGPAAPARPAEESPPAASVPPKPTYKEIVSPIVGTFYRSPAPDAAPFVEVGTRVVKGQVLCIVEAMKIMNQIESDTTGTIAAIIVENAQPVAYGQALFHVTPE